MNDVWTLLKSLPGPNLLYGMGDGGDKMLAVCREKGIPVSGVFASDGFARGNLFHGMPVTTYAEAKARFGSFNVLLSFATRRPEVLENVARIAEEQRLFVPDLPAAGDQLFDGAFYEANRENFAAARALLSDERSREVFDCVIESKLTGDPAPLFRFCTEPEEDYAKILSPASYRVCGDFGAYDGDTAKRLLRLCPAAVCVVSVEADPKTFQKLQRNTRAAPVECVEGALWDRDETLFFSASGGRGASLSGDRKKTQVRGFAGDRLFVGRRADFLKFDVEGAEMNALRGLENTIGRDRPDLAVSAYHRPEDLFALPLWLHGRFPFYRFYLRRAAGLPAWDINLYAVCNHARRP